MQESQETQEMHKHVKEMGTAHVRIFQVKDAEEGTKKRNLSPAKATLS